MENRLLCKLARLDDFLMKPLIQGHSGTSPETSRNAFGTNQGTNKDDSQSGPHPVASVFCSQTTQNSGPEVVHDMVTEVHEEVIYCSPSTSSRKLKMNHSTSHPQFRSKNTPATTEADQILLALQQLANNNNSAKFRNNIDRTSKLPESLSTTTPTFNGKSEKFELFEDLSQTSLKTNNQLTEDERVNYFHSLMREMRYKLVKTLMAQRERTWEKS